MDAYEIEELYTTYGFSSKVDSNRFIGCLGLGSKSPFAYTDSFRIISRKAGKEYYYQCLIENGMPKLIKFDETDTDKPSGVRIEFDVSKSDFWVFMERIESTFRFFEVKPKTNCEWSFREYPTFENDIHITNTNYCGNVVVMGNVPYHYSMSSFRGDPKYSDFCKLFNSTDTILRANIGDIDIAVSREQVEMTPRTMEFISKKHLQFAVNQLASFEEKRNTYGSEFEFLYEYGHFLASRKYLPRENFKKFVSELELCIPNDENEIVFVRKGGSERGTSKTSDFKIADYVFLEYEIRFVYIEKPRITSSAGINDWVASSKRVVYLFNDEKFLNKLQSMKIKIYTKKDFVSEVSKVTTIAQEKDKDLEGISQIYYKDYYESDHYNFGFGFYFNGNPRIVEKIKSAQKIFYVRTRFRSLHPEEAKRWRTAGYKINIMENILKVLPSDCFIIGVNDYRYEIIKDDPKYTNLFDYVLAKFNFQTKEFKNILLRKKIKTIEEECGFIFFLKFDQNLLSDGIKDLFKVSKEKHNLGEESEIEKSYYNIFENGNFINADIEKVKQEIDEFNKFVNGRYPIFRFINTDRSYGCLRDFYSDDMKFLQEYIDQIDKKSNAI